MEAHFSFHEQQVKLIHISQEKWWSIVGSCNGLVLVSNDKYVLFLMNPTTLEYRKIPKSPLGLPRCSTCMSDLGYDIANNDYKVITLSDLGYDIAINDYKVITLSGYYDLSFVVVFLNRALHWYTSPSAIVAFDLSDEKFFEVPMPTNTTLDDDDSMNFYHFMALGGCLCMLVCRTNENEFDVWMMKEYGVAESWTKFSVKSNTCPCGFTPMCLMSDDDVVLDAPEI
ncbi:hypothetical protein RDI58_001308 [Solanum bulbocastanum]|uniref:F-box associated beta-propeller type 1 domain-containing protein n=1 Tax=Solanum bulbocastanum TaxID=147425 RepID=A0AAN8U4Y6_SOLBU